MALIRFLFALAAAAFAGSLFAAAQPPSPNLQPAASDSTQRIRLDVAVETKSGQPVTDLRQQDFTILDNKSPRPITSFRAVTAKQDPVEVILFIDAVNIPYNEVAFVRDQTIKFLKQNNGKLAHPTTVAVFKDAGIQLTSGFSTDGNALSVLLERYTIGLRSITSESQWSDNDRVALSTKALNQITTFAATLPGRKFIVWISPGYPLLSGPGYVLTTKEEQQVFTNVVGFSSELRRAKITLFNVNPLGPSEPILDANYYENFLKGVDHLDDAQFADLAIQVLSVQTGGLTLETNSDVGGMIQRCLADADSWYEITFDPLPADKPNQYHRIEVQIDQPALVARSRTGYYANPLASNSPR